MSTLPLQVPKRTRGVRLLYPYTAEKVRKMLAISARSFDWWRRNYPAPYRSKGGRVERWQECPEVLYGIYGTNADSLRVVPVLSDTAAEQARAVGGREAMEQLLSFAVRTWTHYTHGREVEEAAAAWPGAARACVRAKDSKHLKPAGMQPDLINE